MHSFKIVQNTVAFLPLLHNNTLLPLTVKGDRHTVLDAGSLAHTVIEGIVILSVRALRLALGLGLGLELGLGLVMEKSGPK